MLISFSRFSSVPTLADRDADLARSPAPDVGRLPDDELLLLLPPAGGASEVDEGAAGTDDPGRAAEQGVHNDAVFVPCVTVVVAGAIAQ